MSVNFSIEIEGLETLKENLEGLKSVIHAGGVKGMEKASKRAAENIQFTYRGRPGFFDRTGALRASIKGGLAEENNKEVAGFVGAGGDNIGSDGKQTKDYVMFVEFPELRFFGMRNTSFLRPGVFGLKTEVARIIAEELKRHLTESLK